MNSYEQRRFKPQTQEEAREIRSELRARFGESYDELMHLLFEIDTHEINFGDNVDEYERAVWESLPELRADLTDAEIASVIADGITRVMGEPLSSDARRRIIERASNVREMMARTPGPFT
jgi:hypothetical protein